MKRFSKRRGAGSEGSVILKSIDMFFNLIEPLKWRIGLTFQSTCMMFNHVSGAKLLFCIVGIMGISVAEYSAHRISCAKERVQ